jgi:sulfite dehydrogenase (quinone) subunit SoeC
MNPAWSVIFFTVLAGFGQGLAVWLSLAVLAGALPSSAPLLARGLAIAIALLALGLAASFFHLARPLRAWRSAAMWRTSWLSREVIVLPALIGLLALWWLALVTGRGGAWLALLFPAAAIVLSLLLWVCTAMIYAGIRFIQEWAHPLTLVNYLMIGLSSGAVLAGALAAAASESGLLDGAACAAIVLTLAAGIARLASFRRNAALKPRSTLQSATGIHARRLVQMSMGMSAGSFNTREFFHGVAAQVLPRVKWAALLFGFGLPLALLVYGSSSGSPLPWLAALALQAAGLLAERWIFFAQARHPQNLYYQRVS